MNDRGFPERYELMNQLYALICPTLEKYEVRGSNAHHRTQALVLKLTDDMHDWILSQSGVTVDTDKEAR